MNGNSAAKVSGKQALASAMAVMATAAGGVEQRPARGCRRLVRSAALSALLLLSACTTLGPDFVQPDVKLDAQWYGADGALLARRPADQIRWWEGFGDPVLGQLIASAYQNNYNLQVAGLRVFEARAQLGIALGTPYPQFQQVNGDATYSSVRKSGGRVADWEYRLDATVSWEVDFWGKFRRGIESADANLLASIAAYDNALVLLVGQVADTYTAIRTKQELLRVAHENVAVQVRSVQITEARFRGGDIGELDMLQARTQLLGTQATIPPLESALQQAQNALSTLLGEPVGRLAQALGGQPGVIPAPPPTISAGVPGDMLRRRPDVRQAELAAATQSAAVGVALADLYPSFGLSGFLGVATAGSGSTLSFVGGPFFSWNILNYGRIVNNVRVQDARLQQLLVSYQATVLNAAQEVENNMVAMLRSREQERLLAATEASARRSLTLANIGYREGLSDFQRVLDAQSAFLRAQQDLVSARSTTVSSAIGIYRALGGGWEIRAGQGFIDAATRETMQQRVDWGGLLKPEATEPPLKGEGGIWSSPDW